MHMLLARSRSVRYALAVAVALGFVALRWALVPLIGLEFPLLPLLPAIVIVALVAGAGPCLVTTAITTIFGVWLFLPPVDLDTAAGGYALTRLALYAVTGIAVSTTAAWGHRVMSALEANREEARTSQERFRLFMENNPAASWIIDRGGTVRYASKAYYRMFPVSVPNLEGLHCSQFCAPEMIDQYLANNERVFESGEVLEVIETGLRADGSPGEFLVYKFLLPNKDGEPLLGGVAADISAQRLAEAGLREAKEAAEAASRTKDHFIAALSHELRNPLNPVLLTATEMLARPELDEGSREAWELVNKNVALEAALIDDLLDLTRVARGKMALCFDRVDLHEVLRNALETVRPGREQKALRLKQELKAQRVHLQGDAVRLQQIFWNVLSNAVKFTPEGGLLTIETRDESSGNVTVEISDTGIGMTETEIARLFTAFAQGDHAQSGGSHEFGGLGLGMAITQELVGLHGGGIHAQSSGRNKGAKFVIELPTLPVEEEAAPMPSITRSVQEVATAMPMRILLVEDHEPTRTTLARLLTRRGHTVTPAATIAEAKAFVEDGTYDLLVSDIGLPDGDGHALMTELRAALTQQLRGIAISGYGTPDDIARSRAAGFSCHLTKPIAMSTLEAALEETLSNRISSAPAIPAGQVVTPPSANAA